MNRSLFERNAKACENAKHPQCRCACGGTHHGKSHAAVLEELWTVVEQREKENPRPVRERKQHPQP